MSKMYKLTVLIVFFSILCIIILAWWCNKTITTNSTTDPTIEQTGKIQSLSDKQTEDILASWNLTPEEQNQIATEFINQIDAMVQEELKEYPNSDNNTGLDNGY